MKKSLVISLLLLFFLTFGTLNTALGTLTVSSPASTFGFQNGSYIGFRDPITFATAADGGGTQLISSFNASYPNWMFFQKSGANDIYGFYASGVNVTVNSYFDNDVLELACVGYGTVQVQCWTRGAPVSTSGASGVFDDPTRVVTLFITSSGTVQVSWVTPNPGPGPGPNPTATPTPMPNPSGTVMPTPIPTYNPSPSPTLPPLGTNDFQVYGIDLGTVQPNTVITANLHFRFSGSSYVLQSISLPEPFNSWYLPNATFNNFVYMLNTSGESSGDVSLRFAVGNLTSTQNFSGSFSVVAVDAFGVSHTSSGTISAKVSIGSSFDWKTYFLAHPLYIILIVAVVCVLLAALVLFSKRRR